MRDVFLARSTATAHDQQTTAAIQRAGEINMRTVLFRQGVVHLAPQLPQDLRIGTVQPRTNRRQTPLILNSWHRSM